MQLPLLLFVDLLHTSCFQQCIAAFRRVRLEERAFIEVGSTDVDVLLRDIVHRQLLCLLALLGSILSQLERKRQCVIVAYDLCMSILNIISILCKFAYLQFESLQFLFPKSVEEFFPAQEPLLHSKLSKSVCAERAVALHHTESASSSTGNTSEALAPRKEEHRHLVKGNIAPSCPL